MVNNVNTKCGEVDQPTITRKFVGEESLGELLDKTLKGQVDTVVKSIYHAIQANAVTSQITQSEGEEQL